MKVTQNPISQAFEGLPGALGQMNQATNSGSVPLNINLGDPLAAVKQALANAEKALAAADKWVSKHPIEASLRVYVANWVRNTLPKLGNLILQYGRQAVAKAMNPPPDPPEPPVIPTDPRSAVSSASSSSSSATIPTALQNTVNAIVAPLGAQGAPLLGVILPYADQLATIYQENGSTFSTTA